MKYIIDISKYRGVKSFVKRAKFKRNVAKAPLIKFEMSDENKEKMLNFLRLGEKRYFENNYNCNLQMNIKQAIETIPDSIIRAQALVAVLTLPSGRPNEPARENLGLVIWDAFLWDETKEGYDYWENVGLSYMNHEI